MTRYQISALTLLLPLLSVGTAKGQSVSVRTVSALVSSDVEQNIVQQTLTLLNAMNESANDDGKHIKDRLKPLAADRNTHSKAVISTMADLWEQSPMCCITSDVELRLKPHSPSQGYLTRGVTVDVLEAGSEAAFCPLTLTYSAEGYLADVSLSLPPDIVRGVMADGITDTEVNNRQVMLGFVEAWLTAYSRKDGSMLKQIYGEEPLVITPNGLKKKGDDRTANAMRSGLGSEMNKRIVADRKAYLQQVQKTMSKAPWVRIELESLKISQHPMRANFYGVSIHQRAHAGLGTAAGWLFLAFNLEDPANPCIEVRAWQPETSESGQSLSANEVLSINNFNIR